MKALALVAVFPTLAACTPPANRPADAVVETEDAQSDASFSDGTVRVAMNGGEEVVMPASECLIVNGGANGVVRAGQGSFELGWADGGFRVIWDSGSGLYNGDVEGALDGQTVTFNGANAGVAVSGTATCD